MNEWIKQKKMMVYLYPHSNEKKNRMSDYQQSK